MVGDAGSGSFKFNEGMYQMERIHDIQTKMNICKNFCLRKDEDTQLYGFQTWFTLLNSLYLEFAAKLTDKQEEEIDEARKNIRKWIGSVVKLKPTLSGKPVENVDAKVWAYVEELLFNYELMIKKLMVKHKISSPESLDPTKAVTY